MGREEEKLEKELGLNDRDNTLEYLVARKTVEMKWKDGPAVENARKKVEKIKLEKIEDEKPKVKITRATVWGGGEEKVVVKKKELDEKEGVENDKKLEEVKKEKKIEKDAEETKKTVEKVAEETAKKVEKKIDEVAEKEVKQKKNALYVVEDEKSAQFRYRVLNVQEATENSENWAVKYVTKNEIKKSWDALGKADLVVILRQTAKDDVVLDFIAEAKRRGIKVLFDLDDLVFDYRDLPVLMLATNSKNVAYWTGYIWGIRRIAKEVDGFLVTNEFLGDKLKRSFGKPFKVIRNSLNKKQIEVSEKETEVKEVEEEEAGDEELMEIMDGLGKTKKRSSDFVIGYFSGSPTHVKDFRLVEPELVRFLKDYVDARMRIVGYMELSAEMKKMKSLGKVEVVRLVDYLELQKLMGEVDVNIAPLVINDFTNCKSELKFFEAGVAETITIASPNFSFERAIRDGKNGFLARPGEWYGKLQKVYANVKESDKIAKQAKKDALENYFGEKVLKEIEEAYEFFDK